MSITAESHRILIGSRDWRHPAWQGPFYPDDLPPDWQLIYYGNEFAVVLLPREVWQAPQRVNLPEWQQNCSEGFRFLIEVPLEAVPTAAAGGAAFEKFLAELRPLHGRIAALVLPCVAAQVEHILQTSRGEYQTLLDFGSDVDITPTLLQQCKAAAVGICWHAAGRLYNVDTAVPIVVRVAGEVRDLKVLRKLLETCLQQTTPQQSVYVIFEGQPPSLEVMDNAKTMLELL